MGNTLPKYAQEDDGTGNTADAWVSKILKQKEERDLEGQSDIRSSLIDVGRNLEALAKGGNRKDATPKKTLERVKLKNSYFIVKERDVVDLNTGEVINTIILLVCKDQALTNILFTYDVYQSETEVEAGFLSVTKYPVFAGESLAMRLPQLRACTYTTANIKALVEWLETEYQEMVVKIEKQLEQGKISYDGLWYLFDRGNRFFTTIRKNLVVGSEVLHARYTQSIFEPHFQVSGEVVKTDGTKFFTEEKHFELSQFHGLKDLDELTVKPMTKSVLAQLTARGKIFEKIALGHHFLNYERFIFYQHAAYRIHYTKADGRVMVDVATFNRMNPSYTEFGASAHVDPVQQQQFNLRNQLYNQGNPYYYQQQQQRMLQQQMAATNNNFFNQNMALSEENLYKTWPTVAGFSFAAKAWGEIVITNLSEIQFDDDAYDNLVLPGEKKTLIKALVEDNKASQSDARSSFTDIISGKGGGVIFLLHGPPGVGKTLTAEAIAELLHRPLYSVSVGELGTTAEQLEKKLQDILELASIWDAVVLIDEADIFLEKRTRHDIVRNAMVGIFLRKLEYHQGVLFLTTNRVKCFDPAFNSRVSVAIKYNELDIPSRAQVWRNLLAAAKDKNLQSQSEELGKYQLNGRQIRTTIRLALALARSEGREMSDEHVRTTVNISHQFETELMLEEVKQGDDDFSPQKEKEKVKTV